MRVLLAVLESIAAYVLMAVLLMVGGIGVLCETVRPRRRG